MRFQHLSQGRQYLRKGRRTFDDLRINAVKSRVPICKTHAGINIGAEGLNGAIKPNKRKADLANARRIIGRCFDVNRNKLVRAALQFCWLYGVFKQNGRSGGHR